MSNIPVRIGTLGFISAISRTILAIATLGFIDVEEEKKGSGDGGGSGKNVPWGEQPVSYPSFYQVQRQHYSTQEIAAFAISAGVI